VPRRLRTTSHDLAGPVHGVARRAELEFSLVSLIESDELGNALGGPADRHDEQARGEGVERAGVADLTQARGAPNQVHTSCEVGPQACRSGGSRSGPPYKRHDT